ncbi:MAG: hypothetical protein JSW37_07225 [Anaerolineales bacterium]|nr:MAG: hypothetical protein JSW37_07225 [Anaerolineales bacterium]
MTIEEDTGETFESRTYHLEPTPEAYMLSFNVLRANGQESFAHRQNFWQIVRSGLSKKPRLSS